MRCNAKSLLRKFISKHNRLVPESPRWLVVKGRRKDAERVIRKIAATNGKIYPENLDLSPLFEVKMNPFTI